MSALNSPPAPGYTRVFENPAGGFVDVHKNHGKQESSKNLPVALWLAARGEHVCLLPIIDVPGIKSLDATRNGVIWEFKIPEGRTANAIDKALRDGSKQAARLLLKLPEDFDRAHLRGRNLQSNSTHPSVAGSGCFTGGSVIQLQSPTTY